MATMQRTAPSLSFALALLLAQPALARDAREVSWAELAPAPVAYQNPFEALTTEQSDGLRRLVRLQSRVESGDTEAVAHTAALQAELTASGLDVDGLLAKRLEIMALRRAAATGVNTALVGETVRIPGYVLPLEFADRKAVEFLLVPSVGA